MALTGSGSETFVTGPAGCHRLHCAGGPLGAGTSHALEVEGLSISDRAPQPGRRTRQAAPKGRVDDEERPSQ
jgi:hypothetical protein